MGTPQRGAARQFGEGGAWWRSNTRAPGIPTGQGSGDALYLQSASYQSHGLSANRSGRHQERRRCVHFFGCAQNGRNGDIQYLADVGLIPHKVDDIRRQFANDAGGNQILEMTEGEQDLLICIHRRVIIVSMSKGNRTGWGRYRETANRVIAEIVVGVKGRLRCPQIAAG